MTTWRRAALGLVLWLVGAVAVEASCPPRAPDTDLAIGIRESIPFVQLDRHGAPTGLAIDIWNKVATTLEARGQGGLIGTVEFIVCPAIDDQGDALASGALDLVISPLTITAERMESYDFSQQYLGSGLTVVQRATGGIDFAHATETILASILRPGILMAIVGFLVFNLVFAYLLYQALRYEGQNIGHGETRFERGAAALLETLIRTAGLKGAGGIDSTAGRVLEIFMAVVGTALSATIVGVLTSAFVNAIDQQADVPITRLPEARIATLQDSTSLEFLEDVQARYFPPRDTPLCVAADAATDADTCLLTPRWVDAVELLSAGRVDMVLGDWVALTFLANIPRYAGQFAVQGRTYLSEPYGWGISPIRQDLRDAIDSALIEEMRQPTWRPMIEDALGGASISPE